MRLELAFLLFGDWKMALIVSQECTNFEHKLIFIAALAALSLALYIFSTDLKEDKETGKVHTGSLIYRNLSAIGFCVVSYMLYKFCI